MSTRPRLRDIAERAGVSVATVSRVLNAKQGVAPGTRKRVLDTLGELGYSELTPQSSGNRVVGIITPELDNPIFPVLAQAVEASLARRGFVSFICPSTPATVRESDYLALLRELEATAVIIINGEYALTDVGYDSYTALTDAGMDVILVNGIDRECPFPAVAVDITAAGSIAVRHLVTLGHRDIGLISGTNRYTTSRQLIRGFNQGVEEAGLEMWPGRVFETLYTIEGGRAGAAQLLAAGVTGVVCGGDLLALGAIAGVRDAGRRVPEDVSVVGFDGTSLMAYTDPPLTSVRQPVGRMAATVAELVRRPLSGDPAVHIFEPDLVVGRSTAPPPGAARSPGPSAA